MIELTKYYYLFWKLRKFDIVLYTIILSLHY